MTFGLVVIVVALLLVVAVATARGMDGRFRPRRLRGVDLDPDDPDSQAPGGAVAAHLWFAGHTLGERATLLQLSSAFCAPCRTTRVVLAEVADLVPGVAHVEVDAESDHTLVRMLGILRTPTTVILDATGHEVRRAAGVPSRDEVLTTLAGVIRR